MRLIVEEFKVVSALVPFAVVFIFARTRSDILVHRLLEARIAFSPDICVLWYHGLFELFKSKVDIALVMNVGSRSDFVRCSVFRIDKPRRRNRVDLANAWVDVFVAHGEVVRCTTAFKLLDAKCFELIDIVGAYSWMVDTYNSETIAMSFYCSRFVACNIVLRVLDLARIRQFVLTWTWRKCICIAESLSLYAE